MTGVAPEPKNAELAERRLRAWLTSAPGLVSDVGGDLRPVLADLDRLRAELAETRAAGDALAARTREFVIRRFGAYWTGEPVAEVMRAADAWRSVRGDAPAGSSEATEDQS